MDSAATTWPVCPSCDTEVEEVVAQPEREKRLECPSCGWRSDRSTASGLRVKLTTHKVVIDANDEAHAADLYERLHNDGVRVHRETHKLVQDDLGYMSTEVERVG